jgi:hypothetical protein
MFKPFTHRQKRKILQDEDLRKVPGLMIKVGFNDLGPFITRRQFSSFGRVYGVVAGSLASNRMVAG